MKTIICPGSFDPVTNGHVDIIKRAEKLCDKIIIAVGNNIYKTNFFSVEERVSMLEKIFKDDKKVEVDCFTGLLVDYVEKKGACAILKGLRALSDFEYEFQMALMNQNLGYKTETIFIMAASQFSYISSSAVRELAINGGDVKGMVPACIVNDINERVSR